MDRLESKPSAVPLLSQPVWLSLTPEVRAKLVKLFGLNRSGATETYMGRDSIVRVVSDGYTAANLLAVTKEKMQQILDTDSTDFYGMFDEILANIDVLLNPDKPTNVVKETTKLIGEASGEIRKKRKYTRRQKVE